MSIFDLPKNKILDWICMPMAIQPFFVALYCKDYVFLDPSIIIFAIFSLLFGIAGLRYLTQHHCEFKDT